MNFPYLDCFTESQRDLIQEVLERAFCYEPEKPKEPGR